MKDECCFYPADVLLPKKDFEKWAVIACDQYTSEKDYWHNVEEIVGDAPSALHIILPEAYLGYNDDESISKINSTMKNYLDNGVFNKIENSYIYVERKQSDGRIRKGIVGVIDLECYEFTTPSNVAIRATEETVLERIPPRVKIRKDALLELPHVMLLIDDPQKTVIEPLNEKCSTFEKLYDFDLMKNGGHISGFKVDDDCALDIKKNLELLALKNDRFLFCVGDGNHSLATAKECYMQNKNPLSRYALVEIVNIHDSALEFEPIYRVVFGVEPDKIIDDFLFENGGEYYGTDAHKYLCCFGNTKREVSIKATAVLAVEDLQNFLDAYSKKYPEIKIDYIHGIDSVEKLSCNEKTIGFIFNSMRKDELFPAVAASGSLPRKTFSMGHADDKRFYIEARKIKL